MDLCRPSGLMKLNNFVDPLSSLFSSCATIDIFLFWWNILTAILMDCHEIWCCIIQRRNTQRALISYQKKCCNIQFSFLTGDVWPSGRFFKDQHILRQKN